MIHFCYSNFLNEVKEYFIGISKLQLCISFYHTYIIQFVYYFTGNEDLSCKYLINLTRVIYDKRVELNQVKKNQTICLPELMVFTLRTYVNMFHIDEVNEVRFILKFFSVSFIICLVYFMKCQLVYFVQIFRYCPRVNENENCTCTVDSLDKNDNGGLIYGAKVDCSNKNLTSLPRILPPWTKILNITNNKVNSCKISST